MNVEACRNSPGNIQTGGLPPFEIGQFIDRVCGVLLFFVIHLQQSHWDVCLQKRPIIMRSVLAAGAVAAPSRNICRGTSGRLSEADRSPARAAGGGGYDTAGAWRAGGI